jgi:UDP-N-acetylglucosamine acyltransferase
VGECSIMSSNALLYEGCKIGAWSLIKGGCRVSSNVPPYIIIAHNPAVYYGVNAYVMRMHGFTEEQIDDIAKSYRHVYQCDTSVFNALRRIEADVRPSEIRDNITEFIRDNNMRIVAAKDI